MKLVYSDLYGVDIGEHPWATSKYAKTLDALQRIIPALPFSVLDAPMATDEDILRVHTSTFWN